MLSRGDRRNTMFSTLLMVAVSVMLLQVLLVGGVLFMNGTVSSLEESAITALSRNAENRAITLENQMVHSWSNLGALQDEAQALIDRYLLEKGLLEAQAFGSRTHENELLRSLSDPLLAMLRRTGTTGAFVFLVPEGADLTQPVSLRGLYYRDLDPVLTPSSYEDIQFVKGAASIARKHNIQLDTVWSETYELGPEDGDAWKALFAPYQVAMGRPGLMPHDMSYWSAPHRLNPQSPLDAKLCISYAQPLFYRGRLIGVLGTEMLVDQLVKYFPSRDIGEGGLGGYMLVRCDMQPDGSHHCQVYAATGSYIKRVAGASGVTMHPGRWDGVFQIKSNGLEYASAALKPLLLYNSYTPFSGDSWGLAAVATDSALFQPSNRLKSGIWVSSLCAIAAGLVLMFIAIRLVTRPLIQLAGQIKSGNPDAPVSVPRNSSYEAALLCETINGMKDKRREMEARLREERERYMLALESATSTFLEYTADDDRLVLYSFQDRGGKSELESAEVDGFVGKLHGSGLCPDADQGQFKALLMGRTQEPMELRLSAQLFPAAVDQPTDGGYLWFLMKASAIRGEGGKLQKIVASARPITEQKLAELAQVEARRRDATTGLYHREYGETLLMRRARDKGGSVCAIALLGFDRCVMEHGRTYAALLVRRAARVLRRIFGSGVMGMRYADDELVLMLGGGLERAEASILLALAEVNQSLQGTGLQASAGIAKAVGGPEARTALLRARASMRLGGVRIADREMPQAEPPLRPVRCTAEVSRDAMAQLAFSLMEHTEDIDAAAELLLDVIGEQFPLQRAAVLSCDPDFGASRVSHQWAQAGLSPLPTQMVKAGHEDFARMAALFGPEGCALLSAEEALALPQGVGQLLLGGLQPEGQVLCCAMAENGAHVGSALFAALPGEALSDADAHGLTEITKILATHISLAKSNSASRAKSEFLSRMSHEIRTPMNAIIGMTQIAQDAMADNPARLSDSLRKIDLSAKHLLALINDVLDMSRIESGKMTVEMKPLSLRALGQNLEALLRQQLEGKGIAFSTRLDVPDEMVMGDEQKLRQVLINLLGNAGKFTPSGGQIQLEVRHLGDREFRFSVKDSGVGIAKADQLKIFNAFEQSATSNAQAGRPEGTGLGLAISASLIRAMGGRIELVSDAGAGSEFFFSLRLDPVDIPAPSDAPRPARDYQNHFQGKRVLIVEDNEINLEIATYIVEHAGFQVETARDGQQAVSQFLMSEPGHFDVVFMDISMPVMDGLTATREIRKSKSHQSALSVPIIAMTANAFGEDTKKSIEAGMNGHIAKPIDVQALYALLDELLMKQPD